MADVSDEELAAKLRRLARQISERGDFSDSVPEFLRDAADRLHSGQSIRTADAKAVEALENAEDALTKIEQWCAAYPLEVFTPVSKEKLAEANEALKAIGVDMGAMHAGWARHLLDGISRIARSTRSPR